MDPVTLSLIGSLITLLITYAPEIKHIGENVMLLIKKGENLTEDEKAQIRAYTDEISAKLDAAIAERLEKE